MGLLKALCKKFSCNSNCKYNGELEGCPEESLHKIRNIESFQLNIKDVLKIMKILDKKELKKNNLTIKL
tara:strand:+ start:80 stop:286 length:207 start_codon:yes stop_codon:yes gene_type:complete